jgi:hypothetical protein
MVARHASIVLVAGNWNDEVKSILLAPQFLIGYPYNSIRDSPLNTVLLDAIPPRNAPTTLVYLELVEEAILRHPHYLFPVSSLVSDVIGVLRTSDLPSDARHPSSLCAEHWLGVLGTRYRYQKLFRLR